MKIQIFVGIVQLLPELDPVNFSFDRALLICALSGIFFHLGSSVFNKPIYKALDYRKILVKQAEEYRSYEL